MNPNVGRLVAVLIGCSFLVVVRCDREEHHNRAAECAKAHKIPEAMLREMHEKARDGVEITPTEDLKCFAKCMLEKGSVIKDNKLDVEMIKKFSAGRGGGDMAQAAIDKCAAAYNGDGSCDQAYKLSRCLFAERKH